MNFVVPPPNPSWFKNLLADVDTAFETTGADAPGWADPHPDSMVEDWEYEQVTDQGKYRILDARVEAWVQVLTAWGLATAEDAPVSDWRAAVRPSAEFERVRRITPVMPGGLSLLSARTLVDGEPFGLDLGLVAQEERPVLLATVPDCGCNACDTGSANLLEELDGWFLTVARGGVVIAESSNGRATSRADGWEGSGDAREPGTWLDVATPCPPGVTRWMGSPWL